MIKIIAFDWPKDFRDTNNNIDDTYKTTPYDSINEFSINPISSSINLNLFNLGNSEIVFKYNKKIRETLNEKNCWLSYTYKNNGFEREYLLWINSNVYNRVKNTITLEITSPFERDSSYGNTKANFLNWPIYLQNPSTPTPSGKNYAFRSLATYMSSVPNSAWYALPNGMNLNVPNSVPKKDMVVLMTRALIGVLYDLIIKVNYVFDFKVEIEDNTTLPLFEGDDNTAGLEEDVSLLTQRIPVGANLVDYLLWLFEKWKVYYYFTYDSENKTIKLMIGNGVKLKTSLYNGRAGFTILEDRIYGNTLQTFSENNKNLYVSQIGAPYQSFNENSLNYDDWVALKNNNEPSTHIVSKTNDSADNVIDNNRSRVKHHPSFVAEKIDLSQNAGYKDVWTSKAIELKGQKTTKQKVLKARVDLNKINIPLVVGWIYNVIDGNNEYQFTLKELEVRDKTTAEVYFGDDNYRSDKAPTKPQGFKDA